MGHTGVKGNEKDDGSYYIIQRFGFRVIHPTDPPDNNSSPESVMVLHRGGRGLLLGEGITQSLGILGGYDCIGMLRVCMGFYSSL